MEVVPSTKLTLSTSMEVEIPP